jgi:hypothetical protein
MQGDLVPGEVERYLRTQIAAARDDARNLPHATAQLLALLDTARLTEAASAARAWASFALGMARRLDEVMVFRAGAAAAVAERDEVLPVTVRAAEALRPVRSNGGVRSPGRAARLHDCGPHGHLTATQMAQRAAIPLATVRSRLQRGIPPADIMAGGAPNHPSG